MTKKELNAIRHAAYMAWAETQEAKDLLKTSREYFSGWEITEVDKVSYCVTSYDTQMNNETLKAMGFTESATTRKIFTIDRKCRALTPTAWNA